MTVLHGHRSAVAALLDAMRSDRLHHAWLLAGPQGVGKATFAQLAARRMLAEAIEPDLAGKGLALSPDHPTARLIAAGSHPDFKTLERLAKKDSEELSRSIRIDEVRAFQRTLAIAPTFSERRVVIVDAIDDLERPAANALLKSLEEPPRGTIFLLVSHAPGRLLPTIRSRCRLLRFEPLAEDDVTAVLEQALPNAGPPEIAALAAIAGGAPGDAIRFAGLDIAGLDMAIDRLATQGDASNALRSALARTLAGKAAQPRYEAFLERAPSRIARAAKSKVGAELGAAVDLWRQARAIADIAVHRSLDPQTTVFELAGLVARLAPRS